MTMLEAIKRSVTYMENGKMWIGVGAYKQDAKKAMANYKRE